MNALKSNTVTESWNCSKDNGETMEGKAPAEFSCMLDTWYSNKTVRSFLYCGQNKHIKTLSLAIKWTKLFVAHHGMVNSASAQWISSLIMTLRRAHKTNYRDGVSDYIRLLVWSLWQRLVYRPDLQWIGEHTSLPTTCGVCVYMSMCCVCLLIYPFLAVLIKSEQKDRLIGW